MARKQKQQSLLSLALTENWQVSFVFTIIISVITFGVVPNITNPFLKIFAFALRPFGVFLAAAFGIIALVKFIRQGPSSYKLEIRQDHPYQPEWSKPSSTQLGELNTDWDKNLPKIREPSLPKRPNEWSLKLIQDIEWKKFEELSAAYYLEKGIRAETTSLGADGGIDIQLFQDDSGNPTTIVQCKAWNSRQVGVKQVREFLGVLTHEKISKGFYMTSGEYSADAKEFAKANQITLINGEMLLMMITRLSEESQQRLLALATEGDYTTPSCPSCGTKMVRRSGKRGDFWGCKNYPRCRQMLHLRGR